MVAVSTWARDDVCAVCPVQCGLGAGQFDVSDRPGPDSRYDPQMGCRVNVNTGAPTCVHPYRVGLPAGAYASGGVPVPVPSLEEPPMPTARDLELPDDVADLEGWIVAVLRVAGPHRMASAVEAVEATAVRVFPADDVVAALRRVLTAELARAS